MAENETPADKAGNAKAVTTSGRSTATNEPVKSEAQTKPQEEAVVPQSYVWLSNGDVVLMNDEDLPGPASFQNPFGHFQKDGVVYDIVAVYPVGIKVA